MQPKSKKYKSGEWWLPCYTEMALIILKHILVDVFVVIQVNEFDNSCNIDPYVPVHPRINQTGSTGHFQIHPF